jgi:hypothetical protein
MAGTQVKSRQMGAMNYSPKFVNAAQLSVADRR